MPDTTLERKAERAGAGPLECHNCGAELNVPKNFRSLEKNREYDGFYKSPLGNPFCNKYCFNLFTED